MCAWNLFGEYCLRSTLFSDIQFLTTLLESDWSYIVKLFLYPILSPCILKIFTHKLWNVDIHFGEIFKFNKSLIRVFISSAALFVKVIAKICSISTIWFWTRWAYRCVSTLVLPEPAPAIINTGPFIVSIASIWLEFKNSFHELGIFEIESINA